jgi:hypothetical protein
LICTGHAIVTNPTTQTCDSFAAFVSDSAFPTLRLLHIVQETKLDGLAYWIQQRDAIIVSDGSYKDGVGTAAVIMEGADETSRLIFQATAPGDGTEQSSYRSELMGILASLLMVQKLYGLLALQQSTPTSLQLRPDTSCYGIICAIRKLRLTSPLEWRFRHVEGHQDDFNLGENLNRWGQLNVEVDQWAKAYWATAAVLDRCYEVPQEPWSLRHAGKKLSHFSSSVYNIVHGKVAFQYWTKKDKIDPQVMENVAWEAVGGAICSSPKSRQHFITKHTVGICGTGDNML